MVSLLPALILSIMACFGAFIFCFFGPSKHRDSTIINRGVHISHVHAPAIVEPQEPSCTNCITVEPILAQEKWIPAVRTNLRTTFSYLYLNSSLSTPFSDALTLFNSGIFPSFVALADDTEKSIDPEYGSSFSGSLAFSLHSNRSLISTYTYIHNNGHGHLNKHSVVQFDDGNTQTLQQNDRGKQHFHLHIVDLLFRQDFFLPCNTTISFAPGLVFDDFDYYFHFHDEDSVSNVGTAGYPINTTMNTHVNRSVAIWGVGPILDLGLDVGFLPNDCRQELKGKFSISGSLQYAEKKSRGKILINGVQEGVFTTSPFFIRNWKTKPVIDLLPMCHCNLSLLYGFPMGKITTSLEVGYTVFAYWNVRELNREVDDHIEMIQPIIPNHEKDKNSALFAGPYLSYSATF